ncbi:UNVERIFIED_CONTAM: hypothetical protein H355_001984 [Colinus virginianus]|nr:hypothetical protein H355_001984 [Colinus virginianus]
MINQVFSNNDEALINKKLPKELLLRIFSFLDIVTLCRCAQVSKAWNVLALDGSNWQRIDLFNFQTDIEGRVVENISKRCGGFLRQLSLRGCHVVGDSSLKTFAQNCRNIEHLNLNGCTKITDSHHKQLFERFKLEDEALKHIQNHCHELAILNLQSCTEKCGEKEESSVMVFGNVTNEHVIIMVFFGCTSTGCSWILEAARCSQLTDAGFTLLARNCHELEKMDLEECVLSLSHCELITDDGILHLSNSTCGHERLQVLELDNCLLITDVTLEHLENCHNLERIELYDCQQVTRAGIKRIRVGVVRGCSGGSTRTSDTVGVVLYMSWAREGRETASEHRSTSHPQAHRPHVKVHAYFAPVTPPPSVGGSGQRLCRCCIIL